MVPNYCFARCYGQKGLVTRTSPTSLDNNLGVRGMQRHVHTTITLVRMDNFPVAGLVHLLLRKQPRTMLFKTTRSNPQSFWMIIGHLLERVREEIKDCLFGTLIHLSVGGNSGDYWARSITFRDPSGRKITIVFQVLGDGPGNTGVSKCKETK
jgi:hypothetical protein